MLIISFLLLFSYLSYKIVCFLNNTEFICLFSVFCVFLYFICGANLRNSYANIYTTIYASVCHWQSNFPERKTVFSLIQDKCPFYLSDVYENFNYKMLKTLKIFS